MHEAARQFIHGNVAIPLLWIVIVFMILVGSVVSKASKLLGYSMIVLGVILLLGTGFGHNLRDGINGFLGH